MRKPRDPDDIYIPIFLEKAALPSLGTHYKDIYTYASYSKTKKQHA